MKKLIQILDKQGYTKYEVNEPDRPRHICYSRYDFIAVVQDKDTDGKNIGIRFLCGSFSRMDWATCHCHTIIDPYDEYQEPNVSNYELSEYLFGLLVDEKTTYDAFKQVQEVINFYTLYDKHNTYIKQNFFSKPEEELSLQNVCKAFLRNERFRRYCNSPLILDSDIKAINDMAENGKLDENYDYCDNKPIQP